MKVVHNFHRFFPEACGGIQIHLDELIPYLEAKNIAGGILAAIDGKEAKSYIYNGVQVYRYPTFPTPPEQPNHGAFKHGNFHLFCEWLANEKPDVYHQHQWTPRCGLEHLKAAKKLGIKTVVTLHLPEAICLRGTMMFEGKTACDGKISTVKCSRCVDAYSQKLPDSVVAAMGQLPEGVINRLPLPASAYATRPVHSKIARFVRPAVIPGYANERLRNLHQLAEFADCIVVVADWLKHALLKNGIPEHKIKTCKCGIEVPSDAGALAPKASPENDVVRIAFLGRWNKTKGIHILVDALERVPPELNLKLYIHGIQQDDKYRQEMIERARENDHIQICPQVPRHELRSTLARYDVLAVPSQWLETGPLVVPEAHSVGIPVIGSNLGGIAERVHHNVDGLLVKAHDPKAWAKAFTRLVSEPSLLESLRQGIGSVRTIEQEAQDLAQLYQELCEQRQSVLEAEKSLAAVS
ncbi:MAG: glycosyltransferase [Cyanobacteria bacterium J06636_16]